MAVLSDPDRAAVWADMMNKLSIAHEAITINKVDLRAAVNAIDDFLNTNAVAINNAFPEPAHTNLTASQKARIMAYVALKRWGG